MGMKEKETLCLVISPKVLSLFLFYILFESLKEVESLKEKVESTRGEGKGEGVGVVKMSINC